MHGECTMANNQATRGNFQKGAGINKRKSARFNPLEDNRVSSTFNLEVKNLTFSKGKDDQHKGSASSEKKKRGRKNRQSNPRSQLRRSTRERPSDSPVWRGILDARKTICDGSCTIIATGEDTNLWWQPWIPWMEYEEFCETMEMIRPKAPSLRCVADLMFRNNKTWNRGFLEFLFGHELGSLISTIQINSIAEKDMLIWKNSDTGTFSVKGAYLYSQRTQFAEKKELWKWLWGSQIHPRQSMMLWRAIAGALPTADKYGGSNSCVCPFCGSDSESPLHIFVRCAMARAIWFGGPLPIKTELIPGNSIFDFCYSAMTNMDTSSRHYFLVWFASILETVWLWRNRLYHGSQVLISIDTLIFDASKHFLEMRDIKKTHPERGPAFISRQESPGVTSKMIVTDGSFKDGIFGGAMVAIDVANFKDSSLQESQSREERRIGMPRGLGFSVDENESGQGFVVCFDLSCSL
ncbi:hypothetical protein F8388_018123 [Cannabis sativa]|uniref:Reverse transcriptase zinc-binding domain-containing protein n=2 Tax=Cannabis sativa TaxID=3483 RepID=A0A7J6HMG1_CANSA|nr:hypothetical protein F8388_018123 [Cannabis sativa]